MIVIATDDYNAEGERLWSTAVATRCRGDAHDSVLDTTARLLSQLSSSAGKHSGTEAGGTSRTEVAALLVEW